MSDRLALFRNGHMTLWLTAMTRRAYLIPTPSALKEYHKTPPSDFMLADGVIIKIVKHR